MPIRTRINTKTKAAKAAQEIAGFSVTDLVRARRGNPKVLGKLAKVYREGKIAEMAMPLIQNAIATQIKSEKDWNQFVAQFIKDGSQAKLLIESAQNEASFANMKYVHGGKENKEKFIAGVEIERDRHRFAIDYNRAKLFADLLIQEVEGEARLFEQGARVKTKQLGEDLRFEERQIEMISQYGSQGLELIERRNYRNDEGFLTNTLTKIRNVIGI